MKKVLVIFFILIFAFSLNGCVDKQPSTIPKSDQESTTSEHLKYGIPSSNGKMIVRTGFALLHDKEKKEPLWVSYHLTADNLNAPQLKRKNVFTPDPEIALGDRAELSDYRGSGFDRGHMCPNADQAWSALTMKECFYLSNMCPQLHSLNAGKWGSLESKIRVFVKKQGEAWVVCGPVFDKVRSNINTIGNNKVWVPTGFLRSLFTKQKKALKRLDTKCHIRT